MKHKRNKVLCLLLSAIVICTSALTMSGCEKKMVSIRNLPHINISDIAYEQTSLNQEESQDIIVNINPECKTGETVYATVSVNRALGEYNYSVVDWGDGTWSYCGPFKDGVSGKCEHAYKTPGTYYVKGFLKSLEDADSIGWSHGTQIDVSGAILKDNKLITAVEAISSNDFSKKYSRKNVVDNDNKTVWRSELAKDVQTEEWIGLEFDRTYRLNTLEVKIASDCKVWPSNISVEYTTDRGENWYSLPKYYYSYEYSKDRYSPIMDFPCPKGATLVLPLDGIVANGIRLTSKLFPLDNYKEDKYFEVSEVRAYGDTRALFYSSKGGTYDADLNNMWTIFGSADTEPSITSNKAGGNPDPFRSGSATIASTEWLEWDGMKLTWRKSNSQVTDTVKSIYDNTLFNAVVGDDGYGNDGYVWATTNSMQHLDVQNHYTYNSIFILAAHNYFFNGNASEDFFSRRNARDQTMIYRLDRAMSYMLNVMNGESGLLTIVDPRNDATADGVASNYWDCIKAFGYQSAYENTMFYRSLFAMADFKEYLGENEEAKYFKELAKKVKTVFNDNFWDKDKGRYITSIDKNGKRIDFGITFVNTMAVSAGLASVEKAKQIYSWLDGSRVIEGETSTGKDIYKFKISARTNTVDFASTGAPYLWWDHGGAMPCTPGTLGAYGNQMQNGGTIFYTSYYDLMGRFISGMVESANKRMNVIMEEFHKDQLRRFSYTYYGGYVEGVIGEFPESGLVPLTFLQGVVGISNNYKGLCISPNLPKDMSYAGVREYVYCGRTYSIKVNKKITKPTAKNIDNVWFVELPANSNWIITKNNELVKS